jgi:hypothetical protein
VFVAKAPETTRLIKMRGIRASEASLQERLVFEEDALRKRDLFSVAAGDSGHLPDKYDPVSVFLHQNYQRHYHEAVAVNHHPRDEEEEKKKTDSTLPLSAEASFVSEDDDGPPEDTSDLVRGSHVPNMDLVHVVPWCSLRNQLEREARLIQISLSSD